MSVSGEQHILRNLRKSVETWNFQLMEKSVDEALKAGIPAQTIMTEGLGKGMESIGELFDQAKIYLPQVAAALLLQLPLLPWKCSFLPDKADGTPLEWCGSAPA